MDFGRFAYKFTLPLYQKSITQIHELKYLFIELTQKCNLSCLHCGSDCNKNSAIDDLPASSILKTLENIKSRYGAGNISVCLTGGEPLCYKGLFELGKKINSIGFPWGMVSNGYAWSEETIDKARQAGMRSITISLDGFEKDHNWLRGRDDSFSRAIKTIKLLVDNPFYQDFDIVTCVNRRNLNYIKDFSRFIIDLGLKKWRLFTISPIGRAVQHKQLFLSGNEYKTLFKHISELRSNSDIAIGYSESGFFGYDCERNIRDQFFFCQAGISVAGIMANGDILACPNIDRRFKQGNIFEDSFIDVWENRYKPFRDKSWMKTGECCDCREWSHCRGNSFHLRDFESGQTKLCYFKLLKEG